jgi:hypothetical protein
VVPVTPEVHRVERNDDQVPDAGRDLLLAAGAEVGLGGLKGLDPSDLDLVQRGIIAHSRTSATTTNAAATST